MNGEFLSILLMNHMQVGVIHTVGSACRCAESVTRGIEALGHRAVLANSEEIEFRASELARECDLIIDHTDTYQGRGLLRALVRLLLESRGARVVGSGAQPCFLADDKFSAKSKLAEAGIPTPPGILVDSPQWTCPEWLRSPFVVKPVFEHMSRGLALARSKAEADASVSGLIRRKQPVLLETYVPGRELAVSLLAGPKGIEVLPILEWLPGERSPGNSAGILTEKFKLAEVDGERRDACPANLSSDIRTEVEELARKAFQVLQLRDYGRFDIRLSPHGTIFFLEANTTPSLEPFEALALSARWAGLGYPALVDRMLSAALARYQGEQRREEGAHIEVATGVVELSVPPGVHVPPQSTIDLAGLLDINPGEKVLELGCGTGLLSIAAAKLGASRVVATDLDPRALEAADRNVRANSVQGVVEVRAGSWYEAVESGVLPSTEGEEFDVIIATPPQTPGPAPFGPKYGGPDGTRHISAVIRGAPKFLNPRHGRLWLLAISLANPPMLWHQLRNHFAEVVLVKETERRFTPEEYEKIAPGLFDYFLSLRGSGKSDFRAAREGEYVFSNLFIQATGIRGR